jgi:L,D-transpeptidase-like protein
VSTGREGYDTPAGQYTPFRMEKDHFSREWDDAPMPYSIFFTKQGHAIHGTNHKIDGSPESHGCVRLSVTHAGILWGLVKQQGMANVRVELDGRIPSRNELLARREPGSDAKASRDPVYRYDDRRYDRRNDDRIANDEPDVTGDVALSRGGSWHSYVENGRVYYFRDGPEEIRREPPPYPPRRHVRRRYYYFGGFPYW